MLLRMLPDQVASQWEVVWAAIEIVLPDECKTETVKSNMLVELMKGNMQCWVLKDDEDGESRALATTCFFYDPSGKRSLFIYSLYGYKEITDGIWNDALTSLAKWAKANGCVSVFGHTANESMINAFNRLDGRTDERIVILEV